MTLFPTLQLNESRGWTKGTPYWLIKRKRPESMEANIFTFKEETEIWNRDSVAQFYKHSKGPSLTASHLVALVVVCKKLGHPVNFTKNLHKHFGLI